MVTCPNINLPEYKQLEEAIGKTMAYYYWNKFDGFDREYTVDELLTHLSTKYKGFEIKVSKLKSTDPLVIKNNTIIVNDKYTNLEEFYKYITSNKEVFDYLDKQNISIDKFKAIIANESDIVDFFIFKEFSKQSNPNKKDKLELEIRATLDALNRIRTDITKPEFKDKTINDIKLFIQNSIDKVKQDTVLKDTSRIKKLEDLQKYFEDSHASEKPKIFIDYYHNNLRGDNNNGFVYKFDSIIKKAKEAKTLDDKRKALRDVVYYYNFSESLNDIFIDIDKDLAGVDYHTIINSEKGSTFQKLLDINQDRSRIVNITKEVIPELFAEQMLPYISSKAQQQVEKQYLAEKNIINKISDDRLKLIKLDKLEEKYKDLRRDKETLVETFKSFKDQTIQEYWTSPTISSSDPLLSLFAKFIKDKFEEFRLTLLQFEKKAGSQFSKFKKWNKKPLDNVAKFNEDLYETINSRRLVDKIDDNGKITKEFEDITYLSFVEKYDVGKYNTALTNMLMQSNIILNEKGEKASNKYKAIWYSENTEAKSKEEIEFIIASYKKDLSEQDFKDWEAKYIHYNESTDSIQYRGILTQPKQSIYKNPKYDKIQNTPELKEYYEFLTNTYLDSQQRLPASKRIGLKLPSIPKTSNEILLENGYSGLPSKLFSATKDTFNKTFKKSEIDYDVYSRNLDSKINKTIPIQYTNTIPLETVSLDLMRSVMKFEEMSLKFKTVFDIKNEVKAASIIANNRTIEKVDPQGLRFLSTKAKTLGIDKFITDDEIGNSAKWMEAFIDMQIYNKMKEEEYLLGVRSDKIGDLMMQQTSFTSIGIPNILKSTVNNLQANCQIAIEAWSGEFLNYKDLSIGRKYYISKIGDMGKDIGKSINDSFTNQLIETFDPLQGEWLDTYGNRVNGLKLAKDIALGLGYALQNAGEHQAQVSMLFGMMNTIKLKYNGVDITLLEAFEQKDGSIQLKEGIDQAWNPFIPVLDESGKLIKYEQGSEFKTFVNKVHAINKRLHGVYNKFDKATVERFTAGRLMMFFRKFVVPGLKKRFKNLGVDEELDNITEGTYITLWNSITKQRQDLIKFLTNNENNLTDFQKNNIKRSLIELTFIASLMLLSQLLNAYDDEDDTYAYNFIQYEAFRLQSEMQFYLNPVEFYRVLRTPTITTSKTEQLLKFTSQLGLQIPPIYNPDKGEFYINETFDKNVGLYTKKGDNKASKYGMDLLGLNLNNHDPEYALDVFEKLTRK